MNILEKLGKRVKKIRKEKKFSQEKLKELSWLDRSYISHIESAKVNCSISNLEKLAKWLWVEIWELFK